jgi:uncharacterized membrane protein YhhN
MTSRILLLVYVIVGLVNVAAVLTGASTTATLTKALLMPLLLAWLLTVTRGRLTLPLRLLAVGLVFAWFGDLLLEGSGDAYFMAGIAAFMAMQICYLLAFTRVPGPGLVRAWKIALVPYLVLWLLLNFLVGPGVGSLRIPVMIYSVVLIAMAVAALDLVIRVPQDKGWRVAIGAGLFVVSDALIALTTFGPLSSSNAMSGLIMATYIAAQALIVTAFADCSVPRHPAGV